MAGKFAWQEERHGNEDWVMLPKEQEKDGNNDMLRLVTAVSEVQAILGDQQIKLGDVSRAVRECNYDVGLAVELLLRKGELVAGAQQQQHYAASPAPLPSAPPAPLVFAEDARKKCPFCEVLNPAANVKCFVCDSPLPAGPAPVGQPKSNNNSNSGGNNNNDAPTVESMQIPAHLLDGIDLTKSTELAIKQALYEEYTEKERLRRDEEAMTLAFLKQESAVKQKELDSKTYSCGICFGDCRIEEMYTLEDCFHRFCHECVREHVKGQINDGNTRNISCPQHGCKHKISYQEVLQVADGDTLKKFEDFLLRATLDDDASVVWCPKAGCGMAMYVQGGLMLICPNDKCNFTFCRKCRVQWHADATCEQFKQWQLENGQGEARFDEWRKKHTRPCPKCKSPIEKNGGCNHMSCQKPGCGAQFCWLCMGPYKSGHFSEGPCSGMQFT